MNKATSITPPSDWIGNPSVSDAEREAMALKWIKSARRLRNRSSGRVRQSMGAGVLYYIDKYAALGAPQVNKNGNWGLRYWNMRKDGFLLVPLAKSDAELHPFFADRLKSPSYQEGPRAIFLPPDRFSQVWRALILYHEVGHTVFHRLNIHRDKEIGHWREEYEIYMREIALVRAIYARRYRQLVNRLSKVYEAELRAGNLAIEDEKAISHDQLRKVFGGPASTLERGIQRSLVLLDALYCALNRIHKDGDRSEHYEITRWLCGVTSREDTAQEEQYSTAPLGRRQKNS